MRFFIILFSLSFALLSSCNKGEKPVTLSDDKIYEDLQKEMAALENDKNAVLEKEKDLDAKIEQLASNPKFMELLKRQKFVNGRNLEFIEQAKNYLKIRILDREKYFNENSHKWKLADLESQFVDYSINKKANPVNYPWRVKPPASGLQKQAPASTATPPADGHGEQKPADGHGGGHGEQKSDSHH